MNQGIVYNIQRMSVHDGPGLRTTVFLKGCPLRCQWCSNPESQIPFPQMLFFDNVCVQCGRCAEICPHGAVTQTAKFFSRDVDKCQNCGSCASVCPQKARVMSGNFMTVEEVMGIIHKDSLYYSNSGGGVTIGGGEPTAGGEFFFELAKAVCASGYHLTVDTCGFCQEDQFIRLIELADILLYDCKHMNPLEHKRLTGQDNTLILKNLENALRSNVHVNIRMPLMLNLNDSEENIKSMATFLLPYGKNEVEIMPYHTFGRNKYTALGKSYPQIRQYAPEELDIVKKRFQRYGLRPIIV